jgi:membrane-bound metal-dependent hydrolase YbcI (DUF457 family)
VLVTHPLLDAMTVYGTQLALPFTNHPYAVGSIFIIDSLPWRQRRAAAHHARSSPGR